MLFLLALVAAAFGFLALAGTTAVMANVLCLILLAFTFAAVRNDHRTHHH